MSSRPSATRRYAASPLGRRSLLQAAGATALAGAIGATARGTARAAETVTTDAVVVGAGYAGGTAARELRARGLSVVVLEARNRIGGRIWTDSLAGEQIELGGGWLSPDHHLVAAELQRYGITSHEDIAPTSWVMPATNGFQALAPTEANARMGELFTKFFAGSEQYFERPNEPLFRKDLLQAVDPLSFADRLGQLSELSAVDKQWIAGYSATFAGGDNTRGALTSMAQWWALGGWTMDGWNRQTAYKPNGGMTALLEKMLSASGAQVVLNSTVASITDTSAGAEVKLTSGRVYKAGTVVVAVPVNMWKTITFNPGLPAVFADTAKKGAGVNPATKIWMQVSGNVDAVYGQGPESSAMPLVIPQKQLPGGGRLMIGFAGPSLDASNKAAVQAALRKYAPGATVVAHKAQAWGDDRYARGGWGLRRPGQLLQQLPAIHEPFGRIVFAGSDIASGWNGAFIEGAVESGLYAAQKAAVLA
ncbi:NAD(P)/FAD-dependent oxidoreductase [Streptomyces sp. NBC_00083]|uniref:flavin monoamine oxidase family protein n=1 Tax=Streptomyces sp. NBC_00083 TaxID=2975647 RepID=UPI00225C30AA|nr:NAD(P)/FAD-dependent oxidoreductase [Streptomyces sp. NBC_00083]MCX5387489.1 FAD-dependent oxidoreductase [Streptomyces sp. NBC_00083]